MLKKISSSADSKRLSEQIFLFLYVSPKRMQKHRKDSHKVSQQTDIAIKPHRGTLYITKLSYHKVIISQRCRSLICIERHPITQQYIINSQILIVDGIVSSSRPLEYGVPQGSVLGPVLFTLYAEPLSTVSDAHGCDYHINIR